MTKTKDITFEEKKYTIKSMGFFKSNRLLFKCIGPLTPILTGLDRTSQESLVSQIMPLLDIDLFESIINGLLKGTVVEGKEMDLDDLDYELAGELIQEAIKINYSSLGKLKAKFLSMIPEEKLKELEAKLSLQQ